MEREKISHLLGDSTPVDTRDFSDRIAFDDHKIAFLVKYCQGKDVLDVGYVQHNPENYKSKYWVHGALKKVSKTLVGLDLYRDGVDYLNARGFNGICGDATNFDLGEVFDVIVAGDLLEHLGNLDGFLESSRRHMKDDSRILVDTPNPWYWRNFLKAALGKEVSNNPEHACWLCPRTFRQLVNRHAMDLGEVVFGSTYVRDRMMPLPSGWKHTSWHAEVFIKPRSS